MYTHSLCRGQIIDAVPAHLQQQKRYKQADQCLAMCRGTPQTEMDICQIGKPGSHRESEETLRNNVYERQRKANEIRNRLEQELAKAHIEAKFAWDKGATEEQMKDVLALIRQAQWRWDFGVASHGGSFHAPQEIQRVLSHGLDRAMQARLAISKVLAKHGYTDNVPMPDISTKDKAQEYIGLDMDAERAAKDNFLKTTAPAWLEKAKANNRLALK